MKRRYYRKNDPLLAAKYLSAGLSIPEIAERLEMSLGQLYAYASEHVEFAAALCLPGGGARMDDMVEEALLRRALGYYSKEVYSEELVDADSGEPVKLLKRRTVLKPVPPDVRAALLWLENHRPEKWNKSSVSAELQDIPLEPDDRDLL